MVVGSQAVLRYEWNSMCWHIGEGGIHARMRVTIASLAGGDLFCC
ncbi:hypothetical protein EDE15_4977 [Edaphobacter aggregans]|uniref:Uncharacterized protein n=1 Tax=Edaphobacter aggregans TaxID=570835 RepID=A0A3R9P220_9BACT|nr:hypothetical protein EDE15_4977 [Edaphobacter aggregans]